MPSQFGKARWGYFLCTDLRVGAAAFTEPIKSRAAVWIAFSLSVFPILHDWMKRFWPNEAELALRVEQRSEFGTVARPGTQFAIHQRFARSLRRGGSHHRSRYWSGPARDSWKLARKSGRDRGQRAIFPFRRLAKKHRKFWRITKRRGYCVRFRTCSA